MLILFQVKFCSGRRNYSSFASLSGPELEAGFCLSCISLFKAPNKIDPPLSFHLVSDHRIFRVSELEKSNMF